MPVNQDDLIIGTDADENLNGGAGDDYDAGSWRVERHPRLLGDVNGDRRADIVGFGSAVPPPLLGPVLTEKSSLIRLKVA